MRMQNSKMAAVVIAGSALLSFAPAANAVPYSTTGSSTLFSLGDAIGTASNYDQLQVLGTTGSIDSDPTSITLNTLIFTAGYNANVPADYNNVFSFTESMTIGTGTGTLIVPFNLSINYSDTLTIVGGTTLSILVGSNIWNVVVNGLTIGPNSGGSETGYLTAQVSDPPAATPLPAALVLFGTGLGVMGFFGWRSKQLPSPPAAA
jgi:hypothetical protein